MLRGSIDGEMVDGTRALKSLCIGRVVACLRYLSTISFVKTDGGSPTTAQEYPRASWNELSRWPPENIVDRKFSLLSKRALLNGSLRLAGVSENCRHASILFNGRCFRPTTPDLLSLLIES